MNNDKVAFRVVCGVFLVLCVLMLSSCSVNRGSVFLRNRGACFMDVVKYVMTSDTKLNVWRFTPDEFDFADTNKIYTVEFCPLRARKHWIILVHNKDAAVTEKSINGMMDDVVLRISLSNADSGELLFEEVIRGPYTTWEQRNENNEINLYKTCVYRFMPPSFPWKYSDRIRITIAPQVLNDKTQSLEACSKHSLLVSEWYPVY